MREDAPSVFVVRFLSNTDETGTIHRCWSHFELRDNVIVILLDCVSIKEKQGRHSLRYLPRRLWDRGISWAFSNINEMSNPFREEVRLYPITSVTRDSGSFMFYVEIWQLSYNGNKDPSFNWCKVPDLSLPFQIYDTRAKFPDLPVLVRVPYIASSFFPLVLDRTRQKRFRCPSFATVIAFWRFVSLRSSLLSLVSFNSWNISIFFFRCSSRFRCFSASFPPCHRNWFFSYLPWTLWASTVTYSALLTSIVISNWITTRFLSLSWLNLFNSLFVFQLL